MLQSLTEYIDVDCLRHAALETKSIVDEHVQLLQSVIEDHFTRGTSSDTEFVHENIIEMKRTLMQLDVLTCHDTSRRCLESIGRRLLEFSERITQAARSARAFHGELHKLSVWAEGFDEFSSIHAQTSSQIAKYSDDLLSAILQVDVANLGLLSDEDIGAFVCNLASLNSVCEQLMQSPSACIDTSGATKSMVSIIDTMESVFKVWLTAASKFAQESELINENCDIELLSRGAHTVHVIQTSLVSFIKHRPSRCHRLEDLVGAALNGIESAVIGRFSLYHTEMSKKKFDFSWKPRLFWMQAVVNNFADMKSSSWKQMRSSLLLIIETIKSDLLRTSGEIHNMCRVIATHSGMTSGDNFAKELISLDRCKWIDELLPLDQQFVAKCCDDAHGLVIGRIMRKQAELETIIKSHSSVATSVNFIVAMGKIRPELRELDKFSDLVNQYGARGQIAGGLAATCEEKFNMLVTELGSQAETHLASWTCTASGNIGNVREISQNLDNMLASVSALITTGGSDFVMQQSSKIQSRLDNEFTRFNKAFRTEFSSLDGNFGTKAAILTTIEACTDLPFVGLRLVNYKEAKQTVLELISKVASTIESSIETSSLWDKIDDSLQKFEAATVLDRFACGEVTSRLRTLRRLREQKEEHVDDQMASMIQNHDFRGIGVFLTPLAQSNDQMKKQKFQSHLHTIISILKDMITDSHRLLNDATIEANSKSIAMNMRVLSAAESELKAILASQLNLTHELCVLKGRMKGIIRQFIKQINKAIKEKDFVQMMVNRKQGSNFVSTVEQHLNSNDVRDFNVAKEKIKREVAETTVLQYVQIFFSSDFKDRINLLSSIENLKRAKDMGSSKFPKLVELYEICTRNIESNVRDRMRSVNESVLQTKCFDDGIPFLHLLHRILQTELRVHCSNELVSEVDVLIGDLRRKKELNDRIIELDGKKFKENLDELALQLDNLSNISFFTWGKGKKRETYSRLCKDLLDKVEDRFNQVRIVLSARDMLSFQRGIEFLELVQKKAEMHVDIVGSRIGVITKQCTDAFCSLCAEAIKLLSSENFMPFKEIFADYRGFVVHTTFVLETQLGKKNFTHVNQLLSESLENALSSLIRCVEADIFDSSSLRKEVVHIRAWGGFVADHITLLREVHYADSKADPDQWLDKIHAFCWKHFHVGRDLSKLKYCAILGVVPSASKANVKKAFKEKAKEHHPDKDKSSDATMKFRMIKDAEENLLTMSHISSPTRTQPFDELLMGIGPRLRDRAKTFMEDQRFDMVEKLLFELSNIKKILDDLVVPKLKTNDVSTSVFDVVKRLVEKSRVEVDSSWTERRYRDLNDVISSLKSMERHFKSYPQIFPKSWDTGISGKIETEIDVLGDKARACLQSRAMAEEKQGEFRRYFIQMGFVLTELPSFKDYTKSVMSGVLENCLNSPWGYAYLFELGLALQKGDDESTDDSENRVAQMIVNEFSHFKEVLVMVWNEEVVQKPADEVVKNIRGDVYLTPMQNNVLDVDHTQLLDSFATYENEYKSLVADFIKPDADLNALVCKVLALARQVAPQTKGEHWGDDLKQAIPLLLAGVFSLLTVVKSGASYNRIEEATGSSDKGEKLLMKPHNIQVLTLLLMLGCGGGKQKSIENQLMQIRTGEGKSMILGAASVMFALLGFRVRTVCYSEFLSDRDFQLFEDVFDRFGLIDFIKYSKITSFAEDTTAAKGDIRGLTESLLRGTLLPSSVGSIKYASNHELSESRRGSSQVTVEPASVANSKPHRRGKRSRSRRKCRQDVTEAIQQQAALSTKDHTVSASSTTEPRRSARICETTVAVDTDTGSGITPKKRNFSLLSTTPTNAQLHTVHLSTTEREEILLVDEVDVFFGSEFYGKTYNQVVEFREPKVEEILRRIWNTWSQSGRRPSLSDIKSMPEYNRLHQKLSSFSSLLDNEISRMLDQVTKVDEVPYYLDLDNDRIGYKVMDSISYDVTYGYATCFAYLRESSKLKNKAIFSKVLAMPVSCGQFSYANISPHRILGVLGTLQALSQHERKILLEYGLDKFIYVPSMYGESNFSFDKAGDGIYFENTKSDFYHRITAQITSAAKAKRAVIVFFQDRSKLDEFVASKFYRQLHRHKKLLLEDKSTADKSFVISKAATAGQITLSTAVFGRGTDFFGKDEVVEKNGGVHIIQVN